MSRYLKSFLITASIYLIASYLIFSLSNTKVYNKSSKIDISTIALKSTTTPQKTKQYKTKELKKNPTIKVPKKVPKKAVIKSQTTKKSIKKVSKKRVSKEKTYTKATKSKPKQKDKPNKKISHKRAKKITKKRVAKTKKNGSKPKRVYKKNKNTTHTQRKKASNPNFLSNLLRKINRNKSYPIVAKRAGISGSVKVSFTILPNGGVSNISINGPSIFYKSSYNAIVKSFPIDTTDAPFYLPKRINMQLLYKIY
jgi:protein TonB